MSSASDTNIPNLLMLVRPKNFGYNAETSETNFFQTSQPTGEVASQAQQEFDGLVNRLKEEGIRVQVFEDLWDDLPDSVFPNNWITHIPDGRVVIFPMLTPNRRREVREDMVFEIFKATNSRQLIDLRVWCDENRFLEGTGSIVFDHKNKIAYACESPRTDIGIFEDLCQWIHYRPVSFLSTDLQGREVYHTNVILTVGSGFVIVCLESVENPVEQIMLRESLQNSGHELVEITQQQVLQFAGNCFEALNERGEKLLLMSGSALNAFSDEQKIVLEKHTRIVSYDIPVIEQTGGGSLRCMLTGVFA